MNEEILDRLSSQDQAIARLDRETARLQQRADDRDLELRNIRQALEKLTNLVGELREELRVYMGSKTCPNPGLCLHLQRQLEEISSNTAMFVREREQVKGGWKALAWLVGAVATAAAFVGWVVSHWNGKP